MKTTVKIIHIESGNSNIYRFATTEEATEFYSQKKAQFAENIPVWTVEIY